MIQEPDDLDSYLDGFGARHDATATLPMDDPGRAAPITLSPDLEGIDGELDGFAAREAGITLGDLGFRQMPAAEAMSMLELAQKPREAGEALVPGWDALPLVGYGFTLKDQAKALQAQARVMKGRATAEDERLYLGYLVDAARESTLGAGVLDVAWSIATTGAEVGMGAGVASLGKAAGKKALKAAGQQLMSEALEKAAAKATERVIGKIALQAAPALVAATGMQEVVSSLYHGEGLTGGGAWTLQSVQQLLGREMTDEQAQEIVDAKNAILPVLLEQGGGLLDGMIRQSIEMGAEGAGPLLGKLPLVSQIDLVTGMLLTKLGGKVGAGGWSKAALEIAQQQGVASEIAEEFLSGITTAAYFGDKSIAEAAIEVAEQTPEFAGALLLMRGGMASAQRVGTMLPGRAAKPGVDTAGAEYVFKDGQWTKGGEVVMQAEAEQEIPASVREGAVEGTIYGVSAPAAQATKGGDQVLAAPEVRADGAAPVEALAPEVRAADVEKLRGEVKRVSKIDVPFRVVEGELRSEEVAAQSFLRRYNVEATIAEAPEGTDLETIPGGFYPEEGRAVLVRGQPLMIASAVHEGLHTWEAQQTPERRAEFGAALKEISPEFMSRVEAFVRAQPLYKNVSPAELAEELRTNVGTLLGGLTSYLTTPAGMRDFELAYGKQPGPIRKLLGALYDWIQDKIRALPQRQRALARAHLRVARGEGDPALVAQRVLEALREIRPVKAQAPAAAAGAVPPGPGLPVQAASAGMVAPRAPKTPAERPTVTVSPAGTREERQARREERKAAAKMANTPLPGDTVEYMRKSPSGATIKVTGTVLESTGTGAAQRLRVRINEDVARAGEGRRSASENRARRAENEVVVERGRVRLVATATELDPTSKLAKRRREAQARLLPRAPLPTAVPSPAPLRAPLPASSTVLPATGDAQPGGAATPSAAAIAATLEGLARQQSHYQGNKRESLSMNATVMARAIAPVAGEIRVVADLYAGGGTYGSSIAASTVLPNLETLLLNEVDPIRNVRLREAIASGGAFMDEWDTQPVLRRLRKDLDVVRARYASNTPASDALKRASGDESKKAHAAFAKYAPELAALPVRARAAVLAVIDVMASNIKGRLGLSWENARKDADWVHTHVAGARARGVAIEITQMNAFAPDLARRVSDLGQALVLADPPYREAASGSYSGPEGEDIDFAGPEVMHSSLEGLKPLAGSSLILYHNKDTASRDVREAIRAHLPGASLTMWSRQRRGRAEETHEVLGIYNGLRQGSTAAGGVGSVRANAGDQSQGGGGRVLGRDRGDGTGRADAGAEEGAGGAGGADVGGKFAPRPPKDALVANFLEDAEILDLSSKALRAVSDEFLAVERWQKAAMALGASAGANPISAARRFFGKVAVKGEPIKEYAEKIGDHLRRSGIKLADAGLYAEARHTREAREDFLQKHHERKRLAEERKALVRAAKDLPRDAQFERDLRALEKRIADLAFVPIVIPDGHTAEHYFHEVADVTGMKTSEAEAKLAELEPLPGYRRLGRMIDALNRRTLREQINYQLITPAQFESRRAQFQHYVPLRTAEVDRPERPRGSGFNVRGPETMRRKGRRSLASNPLVMSLAQAMKAVERGEKNAVGHELRDFLQENRGVIDSSERDDVSINDEGKPALDSDEFYLKVAGRDVAIKIENPDVARAMKRLGLVQIPKALRLYGTLFGYWKLAATSLSPEFMLTNFARDIETALVNVSSVAKDLDLKGLRRDMVRGVASAGRTAWQASRGKPVTTGLGDYFEEYRQAGGQIGSFGSAAFEAIEQNMESRMSTSPLGKARRALAPMWSVIEDANGAVEQANRFSLYVALRKRGVPVNDAALAARKITVDFSQKGEAGTMLSLAYAFFSAAVGGTRRLAETMNSPVGRRIAGGLVGLGFAQTLANFYSSDDDEDGRKFYEKISEGEKERSAIIMVPGFDEPLKIPLGYGLNVFHGAGRIMAETVLGMHTEGEAAQLMLLTALNGFAPIGAAPSLAQFISPTALDPAVQVIENQNFMGNPITPYESKFGAPSPRYAKSFRTTAPLAIDMARVLNNMTGGDSVKPGALNLSGDEIEHVYEFVGAGVARFISRAFAASRAVVAGESFSEVAQVAPFLRVVYGSRTEFADSDTFYEAMDTIEYENRYLKEAEAAGDRDRVRELRERFRATLALEKSGKRVKDQTKTLRDEAYTGGKLTDPEKLREANRIMQSWNRQYLEALSAK